MQDKELEQTTLSCKKAELKTLGSFPYIARKE